MTQTSIPHNERKANKQEIHTLFSIITECHTSSVEEHTTKGKNNKTTNKYLTRSSISPFPNFPFLVVFPVFRLAIWTTSFVFMCS